MELNIAILAVKHKTSRAYAIVILYGANNSGRKINGFQDLKIGMLIKRRSFEKVIVEYKSTMPRKMHSMVIT